MPKNSPEAKLAHKRQLLIERTALALGVSPLEAERSLLITPEQSFRINSLLTFTKKEILAELQSLGWRGEPYAWADNGYTLTNNFTAVRDCRLNQEGAIYIQNASSWLPVLALEPKAGEKILDICAAPGGKASHIAMLTANQSELWVNDNSRARLAKMLANFKRLSVITARQTLYDSTQLARKLHGEQFDKILLDAPCSGEGLIRLTDKDLQTWSVAHIKRLQQLQKRIITQAWQLLKPGGLLVYSTCTIAPEENELVVDYLLRKMPEAQLVPLQFALPNRCEPVQVWNGKALANDLSATLRLAPSRNMEAFFVARIQKGTSLLQ